MKFDMSLLNNKPNDGYATNEIGTWPAGTGMLVDVPDEWFITMQDSKNIGILADYRLHLTRAGWEANRYQISQAFKPSTNKYPDRRNVKTFSEFERIVQLDLARHEKLILAELAELEPHVRHLQAIMEASNRIKGGI